MLLFGCHFPSKSSLTVNDLQQSLRQYAAIVESNPPNSSKAQQARLEAAQIYYYQLENPVKAQSIFQKIIDLQPTSSQAGIALLSMAEHDFQARNYAQAQMRYLQFTLDFVNHSKIALAKKRIADCLFHQHLFGQALKKYQDYQRRFAKSKDDAQLLLRLAEIYQKTDQADLARQTYVQILTDFPETKSAIEPMLVALGGMVENDPEPIPDAPIQKTNTDSLRRQVSEAGVGPLSRPDASEKLALWQTSPIFKHNAKILLEQSGMLEVGEVRQSLMSDGVLLDDVVMNLGQQFYMMGDYFKAGACLEQTVALGIRKPEVYMQLGVCYKKAKAWDLARRTFGQLAEIDPTSIQSLIDDATRKLNSEPDYARKSLQNLLGISKSTDLKIQQILPNLIPNK